MTEFTLQKIQLSDLRDNLIQGLTMDTYQKQDQTSKVDEQINYVDGLFFQGGDGVMTGIGVQQRLENGSTCGNNHFSFTNHRTGETLTLNEFLTPERDALKIESIVLSSGTKKRPLNRLQLGLVVLNPKDLDVNWTLTFETTVVDAYGNEFQPDPQVPVWGAYKYVDISSIPKTLVGE